MDMECGSAELKLHFEFDQIDQMRLPLSQKRLVLRQHESVLREIQRVECTQQILSAKTNEFN
jgi:hypothetical protein